MAIGSIIAIYFVVWWIVLFAVLPFGMRTQEEEGDVTLGTVHSAPARPRLVRTALITSAVSAVIVAGFWLAVTKGGLDLASMARVFSPKQ